MWLVRNKLLNHFRRLTTKGQFSTVQIPRINHSIFLKSVWFGDTFKEKILTELLIGAQYIYAGVLFWQPYACWDR
jgi:hypothetical protein